MKIKFYFIALFLLFESAYGQITFQKMIGGGADDRAYSLDLTTDGGYILAGVTSSFGAGSRDFYLVKTNSLGDTLWTKTFELPVNESAYSIKQINGGGFVILGWTNSTGAGVLDFLLVKTDSLGNLIWTKTYGGINVDNGYSVDQTNDGGYIMAGATESFGSGLFDAYLVKTDSGGNVQWSKTYGDTLNDYGQAAHQTVDGGYILCGSTTSFGGAGTRAWLVKTDSMGNHLWSKTYGGAGNDYSYSVEQVNDRGYLLCGQTSSFGAGTNNIYVIKTDSLGNLVWSKTYGGASSDYGYSARQVNGGGYIICGLTTSFTGGGAYLISVNDSGNLIWSKTYGRRGYDIAYSVLQTADGGYAVGGYTDTSGSGANYNLYLIKTDSQGNAGGCNESSPATITSSPATQTTTSLTQVTTVTTATSPPISTVRSGGTLTTLCSVILTESEMTEKNNVTIYPNPTSGLFNIRIDSSVKEAEVEIYNVMGQIIFHQAINSRLNSINSPIPLGIYFVKINAGDRKWVEKLVIE